MRIQASCPASCGELLQGNIHGGEKLISYSINLFSTVTLIEEGLSSEDLREKHKKSYRMLEKVFKYYGYDKGDYRHLSLKIDSTIPIAKGMASSTADLVATAIATAKYIGKSITEEEIAKLCVEIEPTDSTVFSEITLFDHIKGKFYKKYGSFPDCKVMLLEGREIIDTLDFHRIDRSHLLKENERKIDGAFLHFEKGMKESNLKELGKAATISSFANQRILPKEGLYEIFEISQGFGAYGINVAHSGSVVGILYHERDCDWEGLEDSLKKKDFIKRYLSITSYKIIPGGGRIL